jgi:2',3'-cyclic-nucleotide 2'-phosphodiesterase (5'-nucleotidase family)
MGKFKPRANKKKSKRTVYFGLVVFKDAKSVDNILSDSKYLQAKINKLARKTVGYVQNPFESKIVESDDDSEISETELANRAHKEMMEEGGFT